MGDPEPEAEQIRLKCIRKEGFFTVPPEHRVRRGRSGSSAGGGAGLELPGAPECRAKAWRFPTRAGTIVPERLAAGAGAGGGAEGLRG